MSINETTFDLIMRHEGFSPRPYKDTRGFLTVGYGHNLDVDMTQEEGRALLEIRLRNTIRELLKVLPDLYEYGENRANALIDMAFNMGIGGFKGFKEMIKAIKAGNWGLVAEEAELSFWFSQVGSRSSEIVKMLREE